MGSEKKTSGSKGMEVLIPVINKLQEVFNTTGTNKDVIQLPQIVVVGTQSSGKSSVLESLVGKPFLPRGSGIVTRCPILLKLIHLEGSDEWCEFSHMDNVKFTDFKKVEQEIINQTTKLAGNNCGITNQKISLTVYSPDVVTLTVVDLPGIVKVPTGDQPADIESQIQALIMEYIVQPSSIILAVSAANNDLATSESIKYAREVDPQGERTLAVCTKLDLAGDVTKTLEGHVVPVKLGIIGVVNRSQMYIDQNKSILESVAEERTFIETNYKSIASQHGTSYLATKLNRILMNHIGKCFPALDMRIKELALNYKSELEALGSSDALDDKAKKEAMIITLKKFAEHYKGQIEGRSRFLNSKTLCGGARIKFIFRDTLHRDLESLNPLYNLTDTEIMIAVQNSRGIEAQLFSPEDAYQNLVKTQIQKMREVVLYIANLVHQEMENVIPNCLEFTNSRFPKLNHRIAVVVTELLNQRILVARATLENYIQVTSSFIFTNDEEFKETLASSMANVSVQNQDPMPRSHVLKFGASDPILKTSGVGPAVAATDINGSAFNEQQKLACESVREMISVTFQIVLNQVEDYVPKSLTHSLIYHAVDNVHNELVKELVTPEKIEELVREAEAIEIRRKSITADLQAVEKASQILDEVKDNSFL